MKPFDYQTGDINQVSGMVAKEGSMALAGGTTMLDLMKLNVLQPDRLVSIKPSLQSNIDMVDNAVYIGAGCTMSQVAADETVRESLPMLEQSLLLAASPQIRNMATIGGNLLQRTRCPYFRDTAYEACNKRNPGSGCAAADEQADNAMLAVLGTSDSCIAHYPGDMAVAMVALGATLTIGDAASEARQLPVRELHKLPGDTPQIEITLKPEELILSVSVPMSPKANNSVYYKVRERSSYAFALASVAAGFEMDGETIKDACLALGGVGTVPWHPAEAEQMLIGERATDELFAKVADKAMEGAKGSGHNDYKIPLAKRAIVRALKMLRDGEAPRGEDLWHLQHGR